MGDLDQLERMISSVNYNKDLRVESQHCCILAMGYSLAFAKRALRENDDVILEDEWSFYQLSVKKLGTALNCPAPLRNRGIEGLYLWWWNGKSIF